LDSENEFVIPFAPQAEPATFDAVCRIPGNNWLAANPDYKDRPSPKNRPRDYWSNFELDLCIAFNGMCGWCAMRIMTKGEVDHFIPVATLKQTGQDHLAYEWSNFRYIEGWINQKKLNSSVLDPFVVQDGWFEIALPSLQLLPTHKIPEHHLTLALFTLKRLGLQNHEVIVRYRQNWFDLYIRNELNLDGLRKQAPLIAEAVERDLLAGKDWRLP
jgi:hypothetical protein